MDLFIPEQTLDFNHEKTATPVPDNQAEWAHVLLRELSKQAPYAMEYAPSLKILHYDEDSSTALGLFELSNSTQSALADPRKMVSSAPKALIPVVIKNNDLSPLDLLMTQSGKLYPLTESRLREALFRPETFELLAKDPGDNSIRDIFGIGGESGLGTNGIDVIEGTGMKYSSKMEEYPLLSKIADTVLRPDINGVAKELNESPALTKVSTQNQKFLGALRVLSEAEKVARGDTLDLYRALDQIAPTHVMQFGSNHDGTYWAKSASRDYYGPTTTKISRRELIKMASEALAVKVDKEGTVTVSKEDMSKVASTDTEKWNIVTSPGVYKVRTLDGRDLVGWVLPQLRDFDGTKLPLSVFTNGSESAVQSEIVGSYQTMAFDLPFSAPTGTGVFVSTIHGDVSATEPLMIMGSEDLRGGTKYLVKTLTGEERAVCIIPGVQRTVDTGGGEIYLPDTTKFLTIDKEEAVSLVDSVGSLDKTAAHEDLAELVIYGDGDYFSMRHTGLPKLASVIPTRMTYDEAVFALCSAGCAADTAHKTLKEASYGSGISTFGVRDVTLADDTNDSYRSKVSASSRDVRALRRNLIKEAAVLTDASTIDATLGLQFINSENIRVYISHIPYFDKCTNLLCEMLLAARLGISEIPEYAASRAARAMDEVIQGLRALALRKAGETVN